MAMKKAKSFNQLVRTSCAQLKPFTPANDNQFAAVESFKTSPNLLLKGAPRTGKTFLGMFLALNEIESGRYSKLIVIRSAVPSREMGFLPGSAEQKMEVYEAPYTGIISELYTNPAVYNNLKSNGVFEFLPTSFLRGRTFRDCIVLIDEAQNMSFHELNTIITRLWKRTRIIISGDSGQCDFRTRAESGFDRAAEGIAKMESFRTVEFGIADIVGSPVIAEWLIATGQV